MSIADKIRQAKSREELQGLIQVTKTAEFASKITRRKWRRLIETKSF